ncbi:MAG: class I SAM-dependent methyltransferase [Bacteroidaceae bacterium]|nr:class I SAM-dependent methyltransferase [Bacteroidaceae bacterium]
MDKITIDVCPLCGGNHFKSLMTCTDFYATKETFELYTCTDCGFTFTQDVPKGSSIDKYYETPSYISHSDTRTGAINIVYHYVRSFMLKKKVQLVINTSHLKVGRLLDIGTGTGYFPHAMQSCGWKVEAIEKNLKAQDFAHEHFNIQVKGDEALYKYKKESFDAITLWHVMEHLESINDVWELLYSLLKKNGVLIIAVPNHSSYDAKKFGEYWAAYDVPRHLWHFTPETMQKMAIKHHFYLSKQYSMPFDAFYISMLSEKYKGCKFNFFTGAYCGLLAWLHSLNNKEKSSSIIYVFRKKYINEE